MLIPRSYVEAYSRSLNDVSDRGRAALEEALDKVDFTQDVASIREQVISIMQTYCGASATMSARLAAEFYDGLRAEFGIDDGYQAVVEPLVEPEATEGAVRAFMQDLVDEKPVEQFIGKCSDRLDYESRKSANRCIQRNVSRDPKKPKWARVPTGTETCTFCIMLASRGFVYGNEDLASHAHANCDCRVVPSWDKTRAAVEGYDPDALFDRWKKFEAIDNRDDLTWAERKMLKLATIDAESPLEDELQAVFVDTIRQCRNSAWNRYKVSKTKANYEATVGNLISSFCQIYGMDVSGEFIVKKGFSSANPDENELWAITRMSGIFTKHVQFMRQSNALVPDVLYDGSYYDIKTIEEPDKTAARLVHGDKQCRAWGNDKGKIIFSTLRANGDLDKAKTKVQDFLDDETLDEVYWIGKDSVVTPLHNKSGDLRSLGS